ncbi:hypothetical protein KVF89_11030 [Nocardioides carbamazepini]|uniref:nitroreductase family protein n=1 Tax=Nocardioides carbamazepini TaxID=2854259 RepID=UPI00214A3795|nr:nitroreductase family protein [Nocardioides carbamazepini]MCR1783069.1 hypothetical protein [Nocardioides carbamazepini]
MRLWGELPGLARRLLEAEDGVLTTARLQELSGAAPETVAAFVDACVDRRLLFDEHAGAVDPTWSDDEQAHLERLLTREGAPVTIPNQDQWGVCSSATSKGFAEELARCPSRCQPARPGDAVTGRSRWVVVHSEGGADLVHRIEEWLAQPTIEAVLPVVTGKTGYTAGPWIDRHSGCLDCLATCLTGEVEGPPAHGPVDAAVLLLAAATADQLVQQRVVGEPWLASGRFLRFAVHNWTHSRGHVVRPVCRFCREVESTYASYSFLQLLEVDHRVPDQATGESLTKGRALANESVDSASSLLRRAADTAPDPAVSVTVGDIDVVDVAAAAHPDLDSVAQVCRLAVGLKQIEPDEVPGGPARWTGSGGNFGSPELYGLLGEDVAGVPSLFHYDKRAHGFAGVGLGALDLLDDSDRRRLQSLRTGWEGGVVLFLVFDRARLAQKYGEFSYVLGHLDSGVAMTSVRLAAGMHGWQAHALTSWDDAQLGRALRIHSEHQVIAGVVHLTWAKPELADPSMDIRPRPAAQQAPGRRERVEHVIDSGVAEADLRLRLHNEAAEARRDRLGARDARITDGAVIVPTPAPTPWQVKCDASPHPPSLPIATLMEQRAAVREFSSEPVPAEVCEQVADAISVNHRTLFAGTELFTPVFVSPSWPGNLGRIVVTDGACRGLGPFPAESGWGEAGDNSAEWLNHAAAMVLFYLDLVAAEEQYGAAGLQEGLTQVGAAIGVAWLSIGSIGLAACPTGKLDGHLSRSMAPAAGPRAVAVAGLALGNPTGALAAGG